MRIPVVQALKRGFFLWKQWFRRHQAHLLQRKLCQSGVREMLMVWDTEESHAIGNTILSCPEVLFQELGKKSDGEPEGVAGSWLWMKLSKQTLPGGIS